MPIIPLHCPKCDLDFEFFKIKSDEIVKCPQCETTEENLERRISKMTSAILKGDGWARDNYKTKPIK
jgi:putative FmdB family regulatory protein